MGKLEIYQEKISEDRDDSFWYDGEIARIGKYLLVATGEIRVTFGGDPETYYDDSARQMAWNGNLTDKDILRAEFMCNNWFEVISVNDGDDIMGDVAYSYDDGIELLKKYYKERVFG